MGRDRHAFSILAQLCTVVLAILSGLSCSDRSFENPLDPSVVLEAPSFKGVVFVADTAAVVTWDYQSKLSPDFEIERLVGNGSWGLVGKAGSSARSFSDRTAILSGPLYRYRVRAVFSGKCSEFSVGMPLALPFVGPTAVAASMQADTAVAVTWSHTGSFHTGYEVERQVGGGGWVVVGSTGNTIKMYRDNLALSSGVNYAYRVRALSMNNRSEYGSSTILSPSLGTPSNIVVTSLTATAVVLQWQGHSNIETGFAVEESADGTNYTRIGLAGAGATNVTLSAIHTPGVPYWFRVRAVGKYADGPPSAAVQAQTAIGQVTLSRTSIAFGTVMVNQALSQTFAIQNTGNATLNITSIGSNAAAFAVTPSSAFSVAPGASQTVTVTFTPSSAGAVTGMVSIYHSGSGSPATVSVSGTGGVAQISLPTSSISFGNATLGLVLSQTFTIQNTGNAPLNVVSIASSSTVFAVSPLATFAVAAGASQTVMVTFTPLSAGVFSGTITINHSAPGSPSVVNVSGSCGSPSLSLSRTSIDFGTAAVGQSLSQTFTIQNTGTAALSVTNITSNSVAFAVSPSSAFSVAAGASQTMTVTFTPSSAISIGGTITINHSASGSPSTVSLSGSGGLPQILLSSTSVDFGTVALGQSLSRTFTILNTGSVTLNVTNIASSSSTFGVSPSPWFTVAPGGSQTVTVTFLPSSATTFAGTITINHNATGSPSSVSLSGACASPQIVLSRTSIGFGTVAVGQAAQQTFTLQNTGSVLLNVTSLSSNSAVFAVSPSVAFSVATGGIQTVTVTFVPTAPTTYAGTIYINHNAPGSLSTVSVGGTGQASSGTGDSFANAIPLTLGTSMSGSVLLGSRKYYKVYVASGRTYTATVTALSGDPDLYVDNPAGSQIGYSDLTGSDVVVFAATTAGYYYIEVLGFSASTYSVRVS